MKETKSELKLSAAYLVILGAWLLGVDVQQIILLLTDAEQYTKDIRALVTESSQKDLAAVSGGAVAAVYSIARTWLKKDAD
jgi:diphthamide synthase (EF-2-diphthine--ammonia ligase)